MQRFLAQPGQQIEAKKKINISFFLFIYFFFILKKQGDHKSDLNEDIFLNKHELKSMYLRQVSSRKHRIHEPYGSALNALPLSYPQAQED